MKLLATAAIVALLGYTAGAIAVTAWVNVFTRPFFAYQDAVLQPIDLGDSTCLQQCDPFQIQPYINVTGGTTHD